MRSTQSGVMIDYCDADVMNCLFENNRAGVIVYNGGAYNVKTQFQPNVIGCTFNGGQEGVLVYPAYGTNTSAHTFGVIEDCIFASNSLPDPGGVGTYLPPSGIYIYGTGDATVNNTTNHFTGIIRRNMFWNESYHVNDGDNQGDLKIHSYQIYDPTNGTNYGTNFPIAEPTATCAPAECPKFANYSSTNPSAVSWNVDDDGSASFFLAQASAVQGVRSADASREPLIIGAVSGITLTNFGTGTNLEVDLLAQSGSWVGGAQYGIPSPGTTMTTKWRQPLGASGILGSSFMGYALLNIGCTGGSYYNANSGTITITYYSASSGGGAKSRVTCKVPAGITINAGYALCLWVAQDGSLYWADTSPVQRGTYNPATSSYVAPLTDPFFALRHDANALYTAAVDLGVSPAINAGTPEFLSGGGTSTEFIRIDPVDKAKADNILPENYRQGYDPTNGTANEQQELTQKRLDIGFHYSGQSQTGAPNTDGADGYTTLHPAIRTLPQFPETQFADYDFADMDLNDYPDWQTPEELDEIRFHVYNDDFPRNKPLYTVATFGENAPPNWGTGSTIFAVKTSFVGNLRTAQILNGSWLPVVDQLYALDLDSAGSWSSTGWKPLFNTHDDLVESGDYIGDDTWPGIYWTAD